MLRSLFPMTIDWPAVTRLTRHYRSLEISPSARQQQCQELRERKVRREERQEEIIRYFSGQFFNQEFKINQHILNITQIFVSPPLPVNYCFDHTLPPCLTQPHTQDSPAYRLSKCQRQKNNLSSQKNVFKTIMEAFKKNTRNKL